MNKHFMLPWVVWGALFPLLSFGQGGASTKLYYPEDLREDWAVVRQTIEQSHPDPYRYRAKAELDRLFDAAAASFTGPMTEEDFIRAALPVLKAIGDAGTVLSPSARLSAAYAHSEPLIPITVSVIAGRLYLNDELKGFRSLPTGCELLRINKMPASKILATLRASQVPEGADTTLLDRCIERDFPLLYRRHIERTDRFTVKFRASDGSTGTKDLFALTRDEMRQTHAPKGYDLLPWRMEELPDLRTGWLTLGTLDAKELERDRISPERFLEHAAAAIRKAGAATLVIDLRGAGGADMELAEKVFALIAMKPYRAVQSMSVRSGRAPDSYRYAAPAPEFFASVGGMYLPEVKGRRELKPGDPRLQLKQPESNAFQGKVYVLCDGLTTGAAAAVVMMAKRSGRARVVGEETGSNAASFCGGQLLNVTLPHTGCVLHVPMVRYVPSGRLDGPRDRGEMPTYKVPQRAEDVARGSDTVREALLNLITEMQ